MIAAQLDLELAAQLSAIDRDFDLFHRRNPEVYKRLVQLARDLSTRGHRRIGIGMIYEVLRWQGYMDTYDVASSYKLNNNYRSRYARMIMERELDLAGVFDLRELGR